MNIKIPVLLMMMIIVFVTGCLFKNQETLSVQSGIIEGVLSEVAISKKKSAFSGIMVYAVPESAALVTNTVSDLYPHSRVSDDGSYTITGIPAGRTILMIDINQDGISDERGSAVTVSAGEKTAGGTIRFQHSAFSSTLWGKPEILNPVISPDSLLSIQISGYNGTDSETNIGYRIYHFIDGELILKEDSFTQEKYISLGAKTATDSVLTTQLDGTFSGSAHLENSFYLVKTSFVDGTFTGGSCVFEISGYSLPRVELLSPNGGEAVENGTTITWTTQDYQRETLVIDLYYCIDGGSWTVISTDEPDDGEYFWNTADLPDGNYQVKVVAKNTPRDYQNQDSSDQDFRILHPPVFDGLVAWLDPTVSNSVITQGSEVLEVRDLSGRKNHFTQNRIDSGGTPILDPAGINSLAAIQFSTSNYLGIESPDFDTPENTIFVVMKKNIDSGWAFLIGKDSYNWGYGYGIEFSNLNLGGFVYDGGPDERVALNTGTVYVISSVLSTDSMRVWVDGVLATTHTSNVSSMDSSSYKYTIGNGSTTSDWGLEGWVGEVLHYNRALSDSERVKLEDYLTSKWK